jgi:mannosyltransferase OCH1-like enzyme
MMASLGLIVLLAANAYSLDPTPLLPAKKDLVQCYQPDEVNKTCESIAEYRWLKGSTYANTATVLISATQAIAIKTISPVSVKNHAVCGYVSKSDLLNGRVQVSGRDLPTDKASQILAKFADAMASNLNREICTTYFREGTSLIARGTIGGTDPFPEKRVVWIKRTDGYRVAPRQ